MIIVNRPRTYFFEMSIDKLYIGCLIIIYMDNNGENLLTYDILFLPNLIMKFKVNTLGTRVGPGCRNQTLAVKIKKINRKSASIEKKSCKLQRYRYQLFSIVDCGRLPLALVSTV